MDMSWLNQSNVIVLGSDDRDSRDNQCHSSTILNPLREICKWRCNFWYESSYLPGLIELSILPLLSPMMLHYDNQERIMTNVAAETSNMTGDSEGFTSVLNGLGHVDSVESSLNRLKKQGGRIRDTEVGIEPMIVLRRAGFSGSNVSSANRMMSHGLKRGQIQPVPVQYTNIPIPLPSL